MLASIKTDAGPTEIQRSPWKVTAKVTASVSLHLLNSQCDHSNRGALELQQQWSYKILGLVGSHQVTATGADGTPALPLLQQAALPVKPATHSHTRCDSYGKDILQSPSKTAWTSKPTSFTLASSSTATVPSQAAATCDCASSLTNTIKPQGETKKLLAGTQSIALIAYKKEKRGLILFLILRLFLPSAGSRSRAGAELGGQITHS